MQFFDTFEENMYPTTLILVSKTDTAMSWSNETLSITSFTPLSNSCVSPMTTSVSRLSIKVSEKLKYKIFLS